jgi:hypothetical protein
MKQVSQDQARDKQSQRHLKTRDEGLRKSVGHQRDIPNRMTKSLLDHNGNQRRI